MRTLYVGDFLKLKAVERGTTLRQMCNDLDINYDSFRVSYMYNRMSPDRLLKIAEYLNVDPQQLANLPLKKRKK